jgi:hypothetical protein
MFKFVPPGARWFTFSCFCEKKRFGYILNGEFGMFASVYRLEWLESLTLVRSLPIFTSHIACLNLKIQWSVIMFHINQSRLNSISSLLVNSIICLFVCLVKNPADWSWKIRLNQTAVLTDRQNTILSWQNQFFFKLVKILIVLGESPILRGLQALNPGTRVKSSTSATAKPWL